MHDCPQWEHRWSRLSIMRICECMIVHNENIDDQDCPLKKYMNVWLSQWEHRGSRLFIMRMNVWLFVMRVYESMAVHFKNIRWHSRLSTVRMYDCVTVHRQNLQVCDLFTVKIYRSCYGWILKFKMWLFSSVSFMVVIGYLCGHFWTCICQSLLQLFS